MMQQYMKEIEQEPFDPEEFVERLAWRTISETKNDGEDEFNPVLLHDSFVQTIKDLTMLQERQQKKCERLESVVREEELMFSQEVQRLQEKNKSAVDTFQQLDGKINSVATKVIHLGDQLDNVNGPRTRVVEAQRLMTYLSEFLSLSSLTSLLFTDSSKIDEAADIIQKLHLIAQDLPSPKFDGAKRKIERKYDEIERSLIEEFVRAQKNGDIARMKEIAKVISQFKGYSQCVDAFIEQSQERSGKDVFSGLVPLCEKNYSIIKEVFSNAEQVMAKFVLNIYHLKLQTYIAGKLVDKTDTLKYLKNLYEVYSKTLQLSADLSTFNMGSDKNYLSKLTNNIFQKYLDSYISSEMKCMREMSANTLQKYYESKNHQKKQIQTGGFQDLRRDLQAVIGTRANINIAQIENYGGETFLSEELAITLLQEIKHAFQRCQLLSRKDDMANNATQLLDCLLNSLVIEHLDYALELGLQAVPIGEGKTPPQIYFFDVVRQCNAIIHLLEKLFADSVVPLVISTQRYNDCLQKKKFVLDQIEMKINTGLDRSLNAIVTWVRTYLQTEQKKTDFKPETDDITTLASPACRAVVQYVSSSIAQIRQSLDGNNVTAVLQELGVRLHRVIYDHLLQFQYNTAGAMVAICDLNEYRRSTESLGPLVANLFDVLHSLCNLLLVKPENLQQVCSGEQLVDLDRSVLSNFIQLRCDYKTQKLTLLKIKTTSAREKRKHLVLITWHIVALTAAIQYSYFSHKYRLFLG